MKYLILFFYVTFLQAQTVPCGTSSYANIYACNLEDKLSELVLRVNPLAVFSYEDQEYDDEGLPELSRYEMLDISPKPPISIYKSELLLWALDAKEKVDWNTRVNSISRLRRSMGKCGYNVPNLEVFKKSLVLNDIRLECLESKSSELDAEDAHQLAKDNRRKDRAFGDDVVEEVLILLPSALPASIKLPLLARLAPIQTLLQLGDIDGAKGLIEAEVVDAYFTQGLKDFMLAKINLYLGL